MVTTWEVAKRAGVSQAAVSHVLTGRWRERRVAVGTRDRILKAAHDLNYRPNRLARGLASRKTNTIGLIIRTLRHPIQSELNERLVQLIEQNGFEALLTVVPDFNDTAEMEELYYSHFPEGLILGPLYDTAGTPFLEQLRKDNFPFVVFENFRELPFDQVTHDSHLSYRIAVGHLQQLGHRRIGGVFGRVIPARLDYFLSLTGGTAETCHELWGHFRNGIAFSEGVRQGAEQPTAFVFEDPTFAAGFVRGALRRGLRVPDDVAFVVLAQCEFGDYFPVSFTSVYPNLDEMASQIFQLVIQRIRGQASTEPRVVRLVPRLIPGESSGRASRRRQPDTIRSTQ